MRIQLMAAVSLVVVALAGCSDPPPSGTVDGSSTAVPVEGSADVDTQAFQAGVDDPSDGANPGYNPCPFAGQAEDQDPDPFANFRCTRPFTKIGIHMMSMPDPQAATYSVYITGTAPEKKLGDLAANGTGDNMMYELVYDNSQDSECRSATQSEACDHSLTHDAVEIRLDDIVVATAPLSSGSQNFAANEAFSGTSFSLDYDGSGGVLTLSGAAQNLSYEAVFYEETADGVAAVESQAVGAGENDISVGRDIADFAEVHIHVQGTKINVAQGEVS